MVECLAQGHKGHDWDSNPYSAGHKHQRLSSVLLSAQSGHPKRVSMTCSPVQKVILLPPSIQTGCHCPRKTSSYSYSNVGKHQLKKNYFNFVQLRTMHIKNSQKKAPQCACLKSLPSTHSSSCFLKQWPQLYSLKQFSSKQLIEKFSIKKQWYIVHDQAMVKPLKSTFVHVPPPYTMYPATGTSHHVNWIVSWPPSESIV